jgi:hypothetical protein
MSEPNSLEYVRKQFHIVGTVELAASGKSLKIQITDCPLSVSEHIYYVGREAIVQLIQGHKKWATVFILEPKEEV